MSIDWLPRDNTPKDHSLFDDKFLGGEPPCTEYEKKPLTNPHTGETVDGLYVAWITLNNPAQYNSYTTEMVKGVTAGMNKASLDRSVVAVIFTAAGDRAFCTGGNVVEYAQYYGRRPNEYGEYMDLFGGMVDSILNCRKPVICRVNGMRVAGGQEIGMACDLAISSDLAVYGQAGPRHGSAPVGGSTDFLPWFLTMENAMWNCISTELWSSYKAQLKGMISKVEPVLKDSDGNFVRNPLVRTDTYVEDGEIVYGEFKTGDAKEEGKQTLKSCDTDFSRVDAALDDVVWRFANLFPSSLQMSIDSIRTKKRFFWDQAKVPSRHWLTGNMMTEAFLGFNAFANRKQTGQDVIDFIRYRQLIAEGADMNDEAFAEVLPQPKDE